MQSSQTKFTIRDARKSDVSFIVDLIESTFKDCIILTHGTWNKQDQYNSWERDLNTDYHKIIEVERKPIGLFAKSENNSKIVLDLVFILPEYQGSGIGSNILQSLISEAQEASKSLSLKVLKSNAKAKQFYEQKGFLVVKEDDKRFYLNYNKPN
jgi:N-acetylglutamate synthase-like GNAT family acetyltransferase